MLISGLNNGLGLPANSDQTNQNGRVSAAFLPASLVASLASQQQRQFVQQQDIVPAYPTMAPMGASLQFPVVLPSRNQFQHLDATNNCEDAVELMQLGCDRHHGRENALELRLT